MNAKMTDRDLLKIIRAHVQRGSYILVKHAIKRQEERNIRLPDILRVLEHGRHEQEKDVFDVKNQTWKHAIRGKTINGVDLRVVVALKNEMIIITVITVD
jgi:hypothetical protein